MVIYTKLYTHIYTHKYIYIYFNEFNFHKLHIIYYNYNTVNYFLKKKIISCFSNNLLYLSI